MVITDRKGATQQARVGDILGVRVDGLVSKLVKVQTREGYLMIDCKKDVALEIQACLRQAMV